MKSVKYWQLPSHKEFQQWIKSTFTSTSDISAMSGLLDYFVGSPSSHPRPSSHDVNSVFEMSQMQHLVSNLLQYESPYRGLLLYHALGTGKTCSAISISNALIKNRNVVFISKASIESNFVDEIKKCGLAYHRLNNHWLWIPNTKIPPTMKTHIADDTIRKNNGLFVIDVSGIKYADLTADMKQKLHFQLDSNIRSGITFLHIDDTRLITKLIAQPDLFMNKIIIIDEVHNLTNNMTLSHSKRSATLYSMLMNSNNSKIIMLSGTPLINGIFEMSKIFNILAGYRPVASIYIIKPIKISDNDWMVIKYVLCKNVRVDQVAIHKKMNWLQISKTPDNFVNVYDDSGKYIGIKYMPESDINEMPFRSNLVNSSVEWNKFIGQIMKTIANMGYEYVIKEYFETCLPEDETLFNHFFIDPTSGKVKNSAILTDRIMGLTSSYHHRATHLYPTLRKINIVSVPMSNYQFDLYKKYRLTELDKNHDHINYSKEMDMRFSPVFRIRSRLCCTFAIPAQLGDPYSSNKIELLEQLEHQQLSDIQVGGGDNLFNNINNTLTHLAPVAAIIPPESHDALKTPDPTHEKLKSGKIQTKKQAHAQMKPPQHAAEPKQKQEAPAKPPQHAAEVKAKHEHAKPPQHAAEVKAKHEHAKPPQHAAEPKPKQEAPAKPPQHAAEVKPKQEAPAKPPQHAAEPKPKQEAPAKPPQHAAEVKPKKEPAVKQQPAIIKLQQQPAIIKLQQQPAIIKLQQQPAIIKPQQQPAIIKPQQQQQQQVVGSDGINLLEKESHNIDLQIKGAILGLLEKHSNEYLSTTNGSLMKYGPKMAALLVRIAKSEGNILIYSQFRTLIGLNILALVLNQTGRYEQFKIVKVNGKWELDIKSSNDTKKMRYVFYTGGESLELREIYRHIYNNNLDMLNNPTCSELVKQLRKTHSKENLHGDIIKIMMTTKTGTEGLNLFNVRQVHILEPYWQSVLIDQVIGRAIRYKSHMQLPPANRNVEVFIYISTLDDYYSMDEKRILAADIYPNPDPYLGKTGELTSSDEFLYILAQKKKNIIDDCLKLFTASSIDCKINIHNPKIGCFERGDTATIKLADNPDNITIDYKYCKKLEGKRERMKLNSDGSDVEYSPVPNHSGDIVYYRSGNIPAGYLRKTKSGHYVEV